MESVNTSSRMPSRLAAVIVAAALGLGLFAFNTLQHSEPTEAAVGTTVGCSWVPDSGPTFNFKSACDSHDRCYINHWRDKVGCDWQFLMDMYSYCNRTYQWWQWQRGSCYGVANTYYAGVNTVGWACYAKWIAC